MKKKLIKDNNLNMELKLPTDLVSSLKIKFLKNM